MLKSLCTLIPKVHPRVSHICHSYHSIHTCNLGSFLVPEASRVPLLTPTRLASSHQLRPAVHHNNALPRAFCAFGVPQRPNTAMVLFQVLRHLIAPNAVQYSPVLYCMYGWIELKACSYSRCHTTASLSYWHGIRRGANYESPGQVAERHCRTRSRSAPTAPASSPRTRTTSKSHKW